jgi:hypothetical protein
MFSKDRHKNFFGKILKLNGRRELEFIKQIIRIFCMSICALT